MLRFFSQVQFEVVSEEEMAKLRRDFLANVYQPKRTTEEFSLKAYNAFLQSVQPEVEEFRKRQDIGAQWGRQRAEELDKEYRIELQHRHEEEEKKRAALVHHADAANEGREVRSPIIGNVWQVLTYVGETVKQGKWPPLVHVLLTLGRRHPSGAGIHEDRAGSEGTMQRQHHSS